MGYVLVANADFWNSLPDDIGRELRAIIDEVTVYERKIAGEWNATARQAILDAGSEIRELIPEQRQAWVDAMRPVWDEYQDEIGVDLIKAALSVNH